jgi:hypothetical protein
MSLTKNNLPSHEEMVENIIAVHGEATDFDMESGGNWYERTGQYCRTMADLLGFPHENVIAAYAVISPSLTKELNDKQVVKGMVAYKAGMDVTKVNIGVYGRRNREKFARCLSGDLSAVGGNKVTRFYQNLLEGGHNAVTVDRWACRVALRNPHLQEKDATPSSDGVYNAIQNAYIEAGRRLGKPGHRVQAETWECYRNKYYVKSNDLSYK